MKTPVLSVLRPCVVVLALVLGLTSCTSSSTGEQATIVHTLTRTSEAPLSGGFPAGAKDTPAQTIGHLSGCRLLPDIPDDVVAVRPKPGSAVLCRLNGLTYEVEVWKSESDLRRAEALATEAAEHDHRTTWIVAGSPWTVSLRTSLEPSREKAAAVAFQRAGIGSVISLG